MSPLLILYFAVLGITFVLFMFIEKSKAMRGSNRVPLPGYVDVILRAFFLFGVFMGPLIYLLPWIFLPLAIAYFPSYIDGTERKGGRVGNWLSRRIIGSNFWGKVKRYFSISLVRTVELDPKQQYIFGIHPHGILPVATLVSICTERCGFQDKFPGVQLRGLAASFCFYIPLYRDLGLAAGICDAARYNAVRILGQGYSLFLVPGGATEALYCRPGYHAAYISTRKGFVRLALESGASLVPIYSFGEADVYNVAQPNSAIRRVAQKFQAIFGLSMPLLTHLWPRKVPITVVVGAPIAVAKVERPTDAQVEALLKSYTDAMTALFDAHAATYVADPAARRLHVF